MNNLKLSQRISEETQLKAEEKWIKEALKKIKNQRNCLQIERLHLENLRAILLKDNRPPEFPQLETSQRSSPVTLQKPEESTRNRIEFELPLIDEQACNFEELNLAVNDFSVGNNAERTSYDSEDEDDEMIDDETNDDVVIDMNTFMNGHLPDDVEIE